MRMLIPNSAIISNSLSMEISVIIPTFKPGNYIFECLDSIKNQTICKDYFEVIIVLNGPKYPYYDMLLKYVETSRILNIQILYTELSGVSNARNLALDNILSRYVVFMDDDDIVTENYLEFLYKDVDDNIIAVSNLRTFRDNLNVLGDDYISRSFRKLKYDQKYNIFKYRGFLSCVWGKIIPVKIIGKYRFNRNYKIGEDSLFIFSISHKIGKIILCEEDVIYYRRLRDGSATRSPSGMDELLMRTFKTIISYTRILLQNPLQYNLLFYFSRLSAVILEVITRLKCKKSL